MNYTFYLMRHAQSQHNLEKQKWKATHNDPNFKSTPEYSQLKFKKELVDSKVVSLFQVAEAKKYLDMKKIELIICSPMRRCLETCAELVKNQEGKVRVIVEPLLNSRIDSAWSIGSSVTQLQQEFPHFDFSAFKGSESTWMMHFLKNVCELSPKDIQENAHRSKDYMLSLLSKSKGESYAEFRERIGRLKGKIRKIMEGYQFEDKTKTEVLVISHSCVLNFLLAKGYNQKGKVKKKEGFEHCVPKPFKLSDLLEPVLSSKQAIRAKL